MKGSTEVDFITLSCSSGHFTGNVLMDDLVEPDQDLDEALHGERVLSGGVRAQHVQDLLEPAGSRVHDMVHLLQALGLRV